MVVFSNFIHKELIPNIQSQYRTNNNKILIGHSAMGHFTNYVLATFPEEWSCIISISSFFKLKKFNLVDSIASKIGSISSPVSFYTAQGDPHQDTNQDLLFDSLYKEIKPNPYFNYKRYSYPFANHTTVSGIAIGEILTDFWGKYNVRKIELGQKNYDSKGNIHPDTMIHVYTSLKNHYKDTIYYELGNIIGSSGTYSSNKKYDQAIRILEYGIEQYPKYYQLYVFVAGNQYKLHSDSTRHNTYILMAIDIVKNNPAIYEEPNDILAYLNSMLK